MIEVEAETLIRTSREAVWRHLTRISDWPRWYPGLHGVHASDSMTGVGYAWRSSGQMGRLLYRANHRVVGYSMLQSIEIESDRRPWISSIRTVLTVRTDGPNCRLSVRMTARPGLGMAGRFLLTGALRRRLSTEAEQVGARLKAYVEQSLPQH